MAAGDFKNDIEQLVRADANEQLIRQIGELAKIAQQQVETTQANTQALTSGTKSGLANVATEAAQGAGNFLLKGLTLAPVIGGLIKLFSGSDTKPELPALTRFALPEAIQAEAGLTADGRLTPVDRGQGDQLRVSQRETSAVQNITVNVSAMDSRSFLDRSDDIAAAVREAMLHSHSLNDVVNDL